ncbi:unnamed protein product [Dibothriocephalus latus]|uniref:Adenylate kinase isoenzyme 6 homolog n=1 Tax=Dibothriocephalus latus TaxID=60516 RepID=A0A3P7R1E2_DIBLA|nr:unnamed protein product [Dibothriocephalus latus]
MMQRSSPNILITGTPGCGKSTLSAELAAATGLNYISVNDVAKEQDLYDEYDEENECHVLDEDRVIDELEPKMQEGGQVLNVLFHIIRSIFFRRLIYALFAKQVILDEARESYAPEIVHELKSETLEDLQKNVSDISAWIQQWKATHPT